MNLFTMGSETDWRGPPQEMIPTGVWIEEGRRLHVNIVEMSTVKDDLCSLVGLYLEVGLKLWKI